MVDINFCKNKLDEFVQTTPVKQTFTKSMTFIKSAWWDNYKECLSILRKHYTGNSYYKYINTKLLEYNNKIRSQNIPSNNLEWEKKLQTNSIQEQNPWYDKYILDPLTTRWVNIFAILSLFFVVIFLWFLVKYIFPFFYDIFNRRRYIWVKVLVPRGDTRIDMERKKEIAKDMKEKIGRMAQVYRSMHKMWELSVMDNIMRWFFDKPKVTLLLHYENWILNFMIWTYPEYRRIIEAAISAQYPDASIQLTKEPNIFAKKYNEIIPMEPKKHPKYPIRIFKQLEDDPLNNILDSIAKVPTEDNFTVQLTIKPESEKFNKEAQVFADALYKKDEAAIQKPSWWKMILMPWKFIDFLIHWPSEKLVQKFSHPGANQWDPFIRMTKAEEEALNIMAEEAWKHAFQSWLLLISSSDDSERVEENLHNVLSSYTIYKDEYNNELDQPEVKADLFWWFFKPLWKIAATFSLIGFFYRKNIFTVNELASLWHLPDGVFNRSPIIKRLDYKILPPPDNLPVLKEENSDFSISWIVAEEYLGWDLSKIFEKVKHWALTWKKIEKEELIPLKDDEKYDWEVVEKDWKKYKVIKKVEKKRALKIFKDGVLLGVNVYRNRYTPVYMKKKDRTRHHYIIGKSGTGKSVYISFLARQDIWNGHWLCVIDPHGDLVEDILSYIPKERARDVIYFDAWNDEYPMGLNLYEIDNIDQADRVVNDATEIFLKMFGPEIFGPRIQEYFKYGSLTLLEDMEEGATLIDVPRLFTDEVFREYKVRKVKNPVVRNFWERTYNAMGEREKQEIIPYFTSKFVSFITNRLIRNIIWQTKSAFRFRQVMDEGKILLVNLSKGRIGELNAQLLWMVLVSQIYNAAMSRADIPEHQRRDFYLYVDEFQNFVTWTFADILSEARKYKLALIMAHQYIAQLEWSSWNNIWEWKGWKNSVKDAVFGNVGTMQSFKVWAPDAEFLEKEYRPVLAAEDILGISNYKAYIKLNINNATSRVFSMDTIWTTDYKNPKIAEILKEYSAKKYWRRRQFVEAEISARLGMLDLDDES